MTVAQRGFTLVELVTIMILLGILAFTALPRFESGLAAKGAAVRDQIVASLRYAQKYSVSHRRLVCATVAADGHSLALSVATAFGNVACATPLAGPEGKVPAVSSADPAALIGPSGKILYFQPSGVVSSDGAGTAPADFTLTLVQQDNVSIYGSTGHVE